MSKLHLRSKLRANLLELLVAIGIISIVIFAMIAYMDQQQRETKAVSETLAKLDLEKFLLATLADGKVCSRLLKDKKFDNTSLTGTATEPLNAIPATDASDAEPIIQVGALASPASASLKINTIYFSNITNKNSFNTSTSYTALLTISFTGGVRTLIPIHLLFNLHTDANPTIKTIQSCLSASSAVKVASGQNVRGDDSTIDLENNGFDPYGNDPHILVSERDYNADKVGGGKMDASYCGYQKISKLKFKVTCWASPNNTDSTVPSTFDWIALQQPP